MEALTEFMEAIKIVYLAMRTILILTHYSESIEIILLVGKAAALYIILFFIILNMALKYFPVDQIVQIRKAI